MATTYNQDHGAHKLQLELDMSEYYQGNKSIQEYYSAFISLWSEYLGLVYNNITKTESRTLQKFHKDGQLDWFLVKL